MATTVYVRESTKVKLDAIAKARRWAIAETIDAIADDYVERHGIDVPRMADDQPNGNAA